MESVNPEQINPQLSVVEEHVVSSSQRGKFDEFIKYLDSLIENDRCAKNGNTYTVGQFSYAFDDSKNLQHISFEADSLEMDASSENEAMVACRRPSATQETFGSAASLTEPSIASSFSSATSTPSYEVEALEKCLGCFENPVINVSYQINNESDLRIFYDLVESLVNIRNSAINFESVLINPTFAQQQQQYMRNISAIKNCKSIKEVCDYRDSVYESQGSSHSMSETSSFRSQGHSPVDKLRTDFQNTKPRTISHYKPS